MVLEEMISFQASLNGAETTDIPARILEIKAWTRSALSLEQDTTISINELSCSEPDCPPKQVVVLILSKSAAVRKFEIHKALLDVCEEDVAHAIPILMPSQQTKKLIGKEP